MLNMAAWKFLNIGKANAEIDRLEKELATEKAKVTTAEKEAKDAKEALEANETETVTQLNTQLAEEKTKVTKLEGELTAAKAEVATAKSAVASKDTEIAQLKETIAKPDGEIEKRASAKAAAITAGQGQPPISAATTANAAETKPGTTQLTGFAKVQAAIKAQISPAPAKA